MIQAQEVHYTLNLYLGIYIMSLFCGNCIDVRNNITRVKDKVNYVPSSGRGFCLNLFIFGSSSHFLLA